MKLLLAVDSMTTLNILLDEVLIRSWPKRTEARLLSVVEDAGGVTAVRREMQRREEQITALAVDRLRSVGIPAEVTIMRGSPRELIPFASRKWTTDLVLIRANSRADFRSGSLGSVAAPVVESAPCSVEVVRVGDERCCDDFKILLATDGSPASLTASQVVADTRWPERTEVKVVSVINPLTYSLEEIGLRRDKGTDLAHRAIGQAVRALKNARLEITGEVLAGRVAHGILDRARSWGADLIVLGTHDRRGLKRLVFGGTSAAVAERAHCSVRVVRGVGRGVGLRRAA